MTTDATRPADHARKSARDDYPSLTLLSRSNLFDGNHAAFTDALDEIDALRARCTDAERARNVAQQFVHRVGRARADYERELADRKHGGVALDHFKWTVWAAFEDYDAAAVGLSVGEPQ